MFKKYFQDKKGVVFDMDGTVVDSVDVWTESFAAVLETMEAYWVNPSLPEMRGQTDVEKWHYILDTQGVKTPHTAKELAALTHDEFLKRLDLLEIKEGFWSFVYELKEEKKFKIGMTTNTVREVTTRVIQKLGLAKIFDVVVTGDEVKNPKPDPEIYRLVSKKLGLPPNKLLVFEDSVAGAESAAKAGMDVFVIWSGETAQDEYPDKTVVFLPDFSNLEGAMETDFWDEVELAAEDLEKRMGERKKREAEETAEVNKQS